MNRAGTRNQNRQPRDDRELPIDWVVRYDSHNGRRYYINTLTGESQFEIPTEPARGRRSQPQTGWTHRDSRSGSRNSRNINRNEETFSGNDEEWGVQPGMW